MEILSKDLLGSGVSGDVFSFGERMARYHEITLTLKLVELFFQF